LIRIHHRGIFNTFSDSIFVVLQLTDKKGMGFQKVDEKKPGRDGHFR
jgi:hypothetical protein